MANSVLFDPKEIEQVIYGHPFYSFVHIVQAPSSMPLHLRFKRILQNTLYAYVSLFEYSRIVYGTDKTARTAF